jgi:aryl-alcohol dehydrogenase-like predicted oxidoreductase
VRTGSLGSTGLPVTPVGLGHWRMAAEVHSATLDSGVLADRAVLAELGRLRDAGVVVGRSASGPGQAATIRRALEVTAGGAAPFACVQATWNLLEPSAGPALADAKAAALANPWADVVLSGAVTPAQLEANLAALRFEPDPGELEELAALAEPPDRYWQERAALAWS